MEKDRTCSDLDHDGLVIAIRDGVTKAGDELVSRFGRGVHFTLRKETNDPALLEDLFQETFCTGLQKLRKGHLRNTAALGSFLAGIARNLARATCRRERIREEKRQQLTLHKAFHSSPYESLARAEAAAVVQRVIHMLPSSRDREVIVRFFIQEQERGDICRDLALSPTQFNLVLHRAKERYRKLYQAHLAAGNEEDPTSDDSH